MTGDWQESTYSMASGDCVQARWLKSSHSGYNGSCVEARWAKSSHCASNECAEARYGGGVVQLRDSKDPGGGIIEFTPADWAAFTAAVKASG